MSIDAKEWGGKLNEMGMLPEVVSFSRFTQWVIDLIRAVIADETPNIVKAVLNTPIEQTTVNLGGKTICTYPVVPEGDVPEWFHKAACGGSMSSHKVRALWEQVEREYAHRVAEATAERDKRIAELESEIEEIRAERKNIVRHKDGQIANYIDENDALKQQLAEATAEVSRLTKEKNLEIQRWGEWKDRWEALLEEKGGLLAEIKKLKDCIAELHEPPPNMNTGGPVVEVRIDEAARIAELECDLKHADNRERSRKLWLAEKDKRIGELQAELAKLREEVARLSRPVEGVKELRELALCEWETTSACLETILDERILPRLRVERNAREAAEAERDELREAHEQFLALRTDGDDESFHAFCRKRGTSFGLIASGKNPNDAVLAAYRAEKGKVTK